MRASERAGTGHLWTSNLTKTDRHLYSLCGSHSLIRSLIDERAERAHAIIFLFVVYDATVVLSFSRQIFISLYTIIAQFCVRCMTFRLLSSSSKLHARHSPIHAYRRRRRHRRRQRPFKRDKCEIGWWNLSWVYRISFIRSFFIFSSVWLCGVCSFVGIACVCALTA